MQPATKGFLIGFLFGTLGSWLLALLALIVPFVEYIGTVLFAPARFVAALLFGASASTLATVLLFIGNGLFYGAIGAGIAYLIARDRA